MNTAHDVADADAGKTAARETGDGISDYFAAG
jgi:hypothetical protein